MPLLHPDDPGPFSVHQPNLKSPLLISCDHAGSKIPSALGNLGLNPTDLQRHIAYDIGAEQVAIALAKHFSCPLICGVYSRLVVDLNRHPNDPSIMPAVSDGTAVPANANLSASAVETRLNEIFRPYHQAHGKLVTAAKAQFKRPVIFSVHSFTPTMNGKDRPWHYGVLWDRDEDLAVRVIRQLGMLTHRVVGDNQPYTAASPRGYSLDVHALANDVEILILEIRQDLISDAPGRAAIVDELVSSLGPVFETLT
ncbi:MAG: N-formylglutamate amidohydrolase [Pseudomonadota bacterium]